MKSQFFGLLFLLLLTACGNDQDTAAGDTDAIDQYTPAEVAAQTAAYEGMIDAHDRVMPRMGEIAQMQQNLKNAMEAEDTDENLKEKMMEVYGQLEKANDGMMEWMKGLQSMDELRDMGSQEAILAFTQRETQAMDRLEMQLNDAMNAARELLGIDSEEAEKAAAHGHDHDGHDHDHDH